MGLGKQFPIRCFNYEYGKPMIAFSRWIARILSIVSMFVIGLFLLGGNESNQFNNVNELVGFSMFPIGILTGMIVGWKWELAGGLISTLSLAAFYLWHLAVSGDFPSGPWFIVFTAPGILFLAIGIFTRSQIFRADDKANVD